MAIRPSGAQPLILAATTVRACHIGLGPCLVDKDQAFWIKTPLATLPACPSAPDVLPVLFARQHAFFEAAPFGPEEARQRISIDSDAAHVQKSLAKRSQRNVLCQCNNRQKPVLVRLYLRWTITACASVSAVSKAAVTLHPLDRSRSADLKKTRHLPATRAVTLNRIDHAVP
jgi:hypothetical protein